jgi:hypothetical protein
MHGQLAMMGFDMTSPPCLPERLSGQNKIPKHVKFFYQKKRIYQELLALNTAPHTHKKKSVISPALVMCQIKHSMLSSHMSMNSLWNSHITPK